jgi:hypothetical protein
LCLDYSHCRKYQRKRDLAALNATWHLFQQISADTKDLNDILRYWPQAADLPAVQYTAREFRSGLQFLAFASRRSAAASACFAAQAPKRVRRFARQTHGTGLVCGSTHPNSHKLPDDLLITRPFEFSIRRLGGKCNRS